MCSALAYCPFFMALWPLLLQGIVLIALYHNFQLLSGSRGSNWKKLWPLKTHEFCQYMICCLVHHVCDLGFLIYASLSTQFLGLATTYMWFACLFLCLKCFVLMVVAVLFVYGGGWVFVLMVVAEFFVYYDGWLFCVWKWLRFSVNGGGCVFCLMVVVSFLFMVVAVVFV